MTHLYTCRSAGEQYQITKLDANLDVESSYLVSATECQCPSFERRQTCRHLTMLPRFIARKHVGDSWAHDFERNGWYRIAEDSDDVGLPADALAELAAIPSVTVLGLDNLEAVHNAIAEAVGEPTFKRRV